MKRRLAASTLAASVGAVLFTVAAMAQQITGVPGSPSATTTISGAQLPPPPPKFGGVIKESAKDSKPWSSVMIRATALPAPSAA